MRALLTLGICLLTAGLCACGAATETRRTAPPISDAVREALARYRAPRVAAPADHDCDAITRRYDVRALLPLADESGGPSRIDRIAELVILSIEGCPWTSDPNVFIRFDAGVMTIRQSPEAQLRIRRLLALME